MRRDRPSEEGLGGAWSPCGRPGGRSVLPDVAQAVRRRCGFGSALDDGAQDQQQLRIVRRQLEAAACEHLGGVDLPVADERLTGRDVPVAGRQLRRRPTPRRQVARVAGPALRRLRHPFEHPARGGELDLELVNVAVLETIERRVGVQHDRGVEVGHLDLAGFRAARDGGIRLPAEPHPIAERLEALEDRPDERVRALGDAGHRPGGLAGAVGGDQLEVGRQAVPGLELLARLSLQRLLGLGAGGRGPRQAHGCQRRRRARACPEGHGVPLSGAHLKVCATGQSRRTARYGRMPIFTSDGRAAEW